MSHTHCRHFSRTSFRAATVLVTAFLASVLVGAAAAMPRPRPTGKLSGVVLGPNGRPVARARVLLQDADGSHPRASQTDAAGRFRFSPLRQDNYDVRARAEGQSSVWERNVLVRSGQETKVTLRLLPRQSPANPPKSAPAKPMSKRPNS